MIRYMIHACPARMWYVEGFLVSSMVSQGISNDEIKVWNDTDGWGNLESFVRSMEFCGELPPDGVICHIQDDVIISSDFHDVTKDIDCLAYGFCNRQFDSEGDTWEITGRTRVEQSWHSFQCVCIPNRYAAEFAKWFRDTTKNTFKLLPWTQNGKNDDMIFRMFTKKFHMNDSCINITPNIVDHIDYLIGGTVINTRRHPSTSLYWTEPELIRKLSRDLEAYSGMVSKNKDEKYVCYSLTKEYFPYLKISMKSLLKHNPNLTKIYVLTETDKLPYEVPDIVEVLDISGQHLFPEEYANSKDRHTWACAIRVAHDRFLPGFVDRVLALDCDTIICDDLSPLWDIDLTGKWFAGALELAHNYQPYGKDYYNGGVILHNLNQQRLDNAAEKMVQYLIYNVVPNLDEEALNKYAVPAGKAVPFPTRYNECWCNGYTNDPAIVHYCSVHEWWKEGKPRSEYWRAYLEETDDE